MMTNNGSTTFVNTASNIMNLNYVIVATSDSNGQFSMLTSILR